MIPDWAQDDEVFDPEPRLLNLVDRIREWIGSPDKEPYVEQAWVDKGIAECEAYLSFF